MAHTSKLSTWEAEAGAGIKGQPGLHNEPSLEKKKGSDIC